MALQIENFSGTILEKEPLKNHTTWKVGGAARFMAFVKDEADLKEVVIYCKNNNVPFYVLGNGSNVLFGDDGYDGVIIKTNRGLKEKTPIRYGEKDVLLYFGAGNMISELLTFSVRHGLSGIEFLVGIPATFGGVLKMNAGAFNCEIKDFVEWINFFSPKEGFFTKIREELSYSYRCLNIPKEHIILGGAVRLERKEKKVILELIRKYMGKKKETQPLDLPSCGSVFKNPVGDYAGRIIDELGLKGLQVGGARISEKHGNFIINTGNATAKDILTLMEMVKQKIWLKKKIVLEEEVVIIKQNTTIRTLIK